jgi:hypothetical protein
MIDRYSRPAMAHVWSDVNMYQIWLDIEIAACQAWCDLGVISRADMARLRKATFSQELYDKWFEETRHDVIAFTRAVSASLGPESRWVHHGLTSNDITRAFGINVPLLLTLTYGAGVGLAAFAGVLAAPVQHVYPSMGSALVIIVFAIVVIGGLGSIMGSIVTG